MIKEKKHLPAGLYIVATPIGNLKDITLRALEVLENVDLIACEDTRESGKLLSHYGIGTKLLAYHEHNAEKARPAIIKAIEEGQSVALISDAGTPLISDPGYKLVREVQEKGLFYTTLPGASSVISALTLAGLPTDHFLFCGFVRLDKIKDYQAIPYTLVFLSSPHRCLDEMNKMKDVFSGREVALVREISKMFEEVKRGSFDEVISYYETHLLKGEIVLVVGPRTEAEVLDENALDADIKNLSKTMPTKELAALLAGKYSLPRKDVYTRITKLLQKV